MKSNGTVNDPNFFPKLERSLIVRLVDLYILLALGPPQDRVSLNELLFTLSATSTGVSSISAYPICLS